MVDHLVGQGFVVVFPGYPVEFDPAHQYEVVDSGFVLGARAGGRIDLDRIGVVGHSLRRRDDAVAPATGRGTGLGHRRPVGGGDGAVVRDAGGQRPDRPARPHPADRRELRRGRGGGRPHRHRAGGCGGPGRRPRRPRDACAPTGSQDPPLFGRPPGSGVGVGGPVRWGSSPPTTTTGGRRGARSTPPPAAPWTAAGATRTWRTWARWPDGRPVLPAVVSDDPVDVGPPGAAGVRVRAQSPALSLTDPPRHPSPGDPRPGIPCRGTAVGSPVMVERPPAGTIPDAPGSYQFKDARRPGHLRGQGQVAAPAALATTSRTRPTCTPRTAQMVATAEPRRVDPGPQRRRGADARVPPHQAAPAPVQRPAGDDKSYPFLAVTVSRRVAPARW